MIRLDTLPLRSRPRGERATQPEGASPRSSYTPEFSTREFADSNGICWTVREIVPEARPTSHRTLLTRPGYENGWLSFRSAELACRIAPFPRDWRTISEYELERWCMRAQHAARAMRKNQQ